MADAEPAQEEGGGQAHQGAADDEDRYAKIDVLVHLCSSSDVLRDALSMSMPSRGRFGHRLT
ncbi:hypothetical protein NKH18_03260 [Streptomyces sp. M10(2022)]